MIGDALDANYWRYRGFDFNGAQRELIERFFARWHHIYGQPGVGAYRSQDALFGVHQGAATIFGEALKPRQQKAVASVVRAGYAIAAAEHSLGYRDGPDPHLVSIFRLLRDSKPDAATTGIGGALMRGSWIADVVAKMVFEDARVAAGLPGFPFREAVVVNLEDTLVKKLNATSLRFLDSESADAAIRWGHAVGVAEESLPSRLPVQQSPE